MNSLLKPTNKKGLAILIVCIILLSLSCNLSVNATPQPTYTPYPTSTPRPTYTPYPTPFPSPTSTPPPKTLLEEDFSDDDTCFTLGTNNRVARSSEGGVYNLNVIDTNTIAWTTCEGQTFDDFVLELDITNESGFEESDFGVVLRKNPNASYEFLLSGYGTYCLRFFDNQEAEERPLLGCWVGIDEMKVGRQTNHLKIKALGNSIEIYLNDVLVGHVRDNRLVTGQIGLIAGTFENGNLLVTFDNLKITEP
ncbi:MAG: hypothetical protein AB1345_00980 [Chloroflexota bacterium]